MPFDVVILGAGPSGLFCAITAAKRGLKVLVLDHAPRPGAKIRVAGGGRCNFTNREMSPDHFLSGNPHFCTSALKRFTSWDLLSYLAEGGLESEERDLGQFFCLHSANDLLDILLKDASAAGVERIQNCSLLEAPTYEESSSLFRLGTDNGDFQAPRLVIATGGLSFPKLGATNLGYRIAQNFGHTQTPCRPGLVPLCVSEESGSIMHDLSGISLFASLTLLPSKKKLTHLKARPHQGKLIEMRGDLLFTHRGMSGPVTLRLSNHWQVGDRVQIDLLPKISLMDHLRRHCSENPHRELRVVMAELLPKRLVAALLHMGVPALMTRTVGRLSENDLIRIVSIFHEWIVCPASDEGFGRAEVTLGGVSTENISSKTLQSQLRSGLYFIGEVLDVTGDLGGYNFQWAFASGFAAGTEL